MTVAWDIAPGTHVVQFYEGEPFRHRAAAGFLANATRRGEPALVLSRRSTYDAVLEHLASRGELPATDPRRRIVFLDVDSALRSFMDGAAPDPVRFQRSMSNLLDEIRRTGHSGAIWIYGELAGMLCSEGNHAGALRIEELWNANFAGRGISVMCGYAIDDFDGEAYSSTFRAVCRQHEIVIPTESFVDAPGDRARLEQVAILQQRARLRALTPPMSTDAAITSSTIFVIDDDASMRRSLARLLASANLRVQTFASAEAFLDEVDPASSGCLIVDSQLVGMSGSDLQSRMSDAKWRMPVIAMSGSHDSQVEAGALRLGARAFLGKPFDARALLEAIARAVSS
jgi:CheY-like chemotaxis protein